MNGANALAGDESRADDRDKRETSEEREKQLRVESELSSAAMGLSLLVTKEPTPEPVEAPPPEHCGSIDEPEDAAPAPAAPPEKDDNSEEDDDDTEVTLSTEVNAECRTVPHGEMFDGGGTELKTEEEAEVKVEVVPEKVPSNKCVDLLSTLAARSVDSSTDTLVAQDNQHIVAQLPVCENVELRTSTGSATQSSSPAPSAPSPPLPLPLSSMVSSLVTPSLPIFSTVENSESVLLPSGDNCRVCANSRRFIADSHR